MTRETRGGDSSTRGADDRSSRMQVGLSIYGEITQSALNPPRDPLHEAAMNFVAAEVWTRPGLSRRDRRLATISCVAATGVEYALGLLIRGALLSGDLTFDELQELALHLAAYVGFPRASAFQREIVGVARELGLVGPTPVDGPDSSRPPSAAS
jgi:4-carboxymuconolactone decarboxylase